MNKLSKIVSLLVLVLVVSSFSFNALANHDPYEGLVMKKISLCHDESGDGLEYHSSGGVSVSSVLNGGHGGHETDIIPPFHYKDGSYPGLNWTDQNKEIWETTCSGASEEEPDTSVVTLCKVDDSEHPLSNWNLKLFGNSENDGNDNDGLTGEDGCVSFEGIPYGSFTVAEDMKDGWENVSGLGEKTIDEPTEKFTVVNKQSTPDDDCPGEEVCEDPGDEDDTAHVIVVKETIGGNGTFHFNGLDGEDGFDIATVNQRGEAHFNVFADEDGESYTLTEADTQGWDQLVAGCEGDGQAVVGGETFTVEAGETIRCVFLNRIEDACLNEETNPGIQETVAACPPPTECLQGTHLVENECVPDENECNTEATTLVVSDTTNTTEDGNAVLLSFVHPGWTALINGANWIWATNPVQFPDGNDLTKTFTKTFNIVGTPTSGSLDVAADNTFSAKVNGIVVGSETVNGTTFAGPLTFNVLPQLVTGSNTVEIAVTNWVHGAGHGDFPQDPSSNPAGLLYKLSITNNECVTPPPVDVCTNIPEVQPTLPQGYHFASAGICVPNESGPSTVTVTVEKFIQGEVLSAATAGNTNNSSFALTSTWNAVNIGAGSGNFSLDSGNNYSATTSAMTSGADYSVVENNTATSCSAENEGQYYLEGFKIGDSEALALASATVPVASLTNITSNKFILVINKLCGEVLGEETVKVHIYKYFGDANSSFQVADNSSAPTFPMTASWDAANLGGAGSGSYVLGNNHGGAALKYAADTSPMSTGSDYTTSEVTDGSPVYTSMDDVVCHEGKYRLVGYKSSLISLADAEAQSVSPTAPSFTNLSADAYIIVVNSPCQDDNGGGDNDTLVTDPAIQKTVDGEPVAGSTVTYTLVVTENSDLNATNIVVVDPLPAGVTYLDDDGGDTTVEAGNIVTWTIPSLLAHTQVTLHITATVNEGVSGDIQNVATITGFPSTGNSDTGNDSDGADITVDGQGGEEGPGGNGSNGGGGGSGSRRSSGGSSNNNDNDEPAGEVLGESIGLPRTDSSDTSSNLLILAISGAMMALGLTYLARKSQVE